MFSNSLHCFSETNFYNISKAQQKIWIRTYLLKKIKFDGFWGQKMNIPNIFLCHITVCCEVNLSWHALKFLHCFLKHISTTYPKDSRKYESEPTFLRKLNLMVFGVEKQTFFCKMIAILAISHNYSLWSYFWE